eukprot:7140050-Prymnesium_polylepis.1
MGQGASAPTRALLLAAAAGAGATHKAQVAGVEAEGEADEGRRVAQEEHKRLAVTQPDRHTEPEAVVVERKHRAAVPRDVARSRRQPLARPRIDDVLHLALASRGTERGGRVPARRHRAGRRGQRAEVGRDLQGEDRVASANDWRSPRLGAEEHDDDIVEDDQRPDEAHVARGEPRATQSPRPI